MLEGDLAELIDRSWQARLLEKDGNVRVVALVFHGEGEPVGDFRRAWANTCQAAGVPDKLFHDLRRTAAPKHDARGCSRASGHGSDQARYSQHLRPL